MTSLQDAPMTVALAEPEAGSLSWLRVQRWLLRAGAFILPLIVVWDGLDRFVLPKLLVARLLVIALAVLLLTRAVLTGRWSWRRTALDLPLLAFVASAAISSATAVNHNVALFGVYLRYEGLLTVLTYAALFWLTAQLTPTREDARGLGWTMLASACVVSVIAIFQSVTGRGLAPETSVAAFARAFGTFGSPVELGTFLAMLLPFAFHAFLAAVSLLRRLLAATVFIVLGMALILTFTRAAWFAALIGMVIVLILNRPSFSLPSPLRVDRVVWVAASVALVALVVMIVALGRLGGSPPLARAVTSRAQSTTAIGEGSIGFRLHVWSDSLRLLSVRPLLGSGPDTFGLVYPSVQSGNWVPGMQVDKAHNEILQVAVTQGLLGVLAYYLIVVAIAVQLWRHRREGWNAAMLAGLIAYEVALQAEFSWVPTAVPFWLFAGAAFYALSSNSASGLHATVADPSPPLAGKGRLGGWQQTALVALIVGAGSGFAVLAVVPELQADRLLYRAVRTSPTGADTSVDFLVASARRLNPHESAYAVAAGNLALDLRFGDVPGPRADLIAARREYQAAVDLGTTNPVAFRGLAIADFRLGDRRGAIDAARRAVELNRFDPTNLALLQSLASQQP